MDTIKKWHNLSCSIGLYTSNNALLKKGLINNLLYVLIMILEARQSFAFRTLNIYFLTES